MAIIQTSPTTKISSIFKHISKKLLYLKQSQQTVLSDGSYPTEFKHEMGQSVK